LKQDAGQRSADMPLFPLHPGQVGNNKDGERWPFAVGEMLADHAVLSFAAEAMLADVPYIVWRRRG
jgi:hypothetical protein